MRAYHRVDPLMDERKGHYTPAQLGAFLKVQLLAGRQTKRGSFRSIGALRGLLPTAYVKHLDFLVSEGDLDILEDGSIYVDGWNEWQEGDLTVADRMKALRNRQRNATVTSTVTEGVTRPSPTAIRSSVGVGVGISGASTDAPPAREGLPNLDGDAVECLERRTGRPIQVAGDRQLIEYDRLIADHGLEQVVIAMDRIREGKTLTARQLVWGAMKFLEPMVDPRKIAQAERAEEAEQASRREVERTQDYIRELRGEDRTKSKPEAIGAIVQRVVPSRRESA